jgi:hypothetical protein
MLFQISWRYGELRVKGALRYIQQQLGELGRLLIKAQPPWKTVKQVDPMSRTPWLFDEFPGRKQIEKPKELLNLDSDQLFAVFSAIAVGLEAEDKFGATAKRFENSRHPYIGLFRPLIIARLERGDTDNLEDEIKKLGFSKDQREFVLRWAKREIALVSGQ